MADTQYVKIKKQSNQMKKPEIIIGIDPDCDKSGVAVVNTEYKAASHCSKTFPELLDYLQGQKNVCIETGIDVIVVVEASWIGTTNNWHINSKDTKASAAAKGNSVGRNQETGRKIIEMCKHYSITVDVQRPFKKCWAGPDGKITHDEISYFVPGMKGRSNQEERDALLIAWNHAGYPIKVKSRK